jgi:hypothetical protein
LSGCRAHDAWAYNGDHEIENRSFVEGRRDGSEEEGREEDREEGREEGREEEGGRGAGARRPPRPPATSRGGAPPAPVAKPAKPGKPKKAPLTWRFKTKGMAFGVYVDETSAWVGNESGEVFSLNAKGEVQQSYKLKSGVKCLIADEAWRYAGCNDGNVYDLGSKVPRLVYECAKDAEIYWLDIYRGNLVVSDAGGGLTVVDAEDQLKWKKQIDKHSDGWMVRADGTGIYHGHDAGVTKYDWNGKQVWNTKTPSVLFGWQEDDAVYAGTIDDVIKLDKRTGKKVVTYDNEKRGVPSCAASPGGKLVFASHSDRIVCWDGKGPRKWELDSGCGMALSMQFFEDKLYVVTNNGSFGCIDASAAAIAKAEAGAATKVVERKAPAVKAVASTTLEKTKDTSKGVVVECVKDGGKLRVRVLTGGYQKGWFCQFPKDIRKEGAKYVVDEVREASQGGFYRVLGEIKQLAS